MPRFVHLPDPIPAIRKPKTASKHRPICPTTHVVCEKFTVLKVVFYGMALITRFTVKSGFNRVTSIVFGDSFIVFVAN